MTIIVGDNDISSLLHVICGAAPLSVEIFKRFEQTTGIRILEGYGLTEGACASSVNPKDGNRKIGSIGIRLPYQKMKVVILDDDLGYVRDAKPNEIGTIVIKGPNVFSGYVESLHNKNLFVQDGWMNTGDLGRIDEDSFFWLTGRKKDLIIRGGHNIDPGCIEEVLYRHADVQLAAAVGSPHPKVGEVPVAFVQLADGSAATSDTLLEYMRIHIGEQAAIPKSVFIITPMPLTPVGKIFKPALRWQAINKVYSDELSHLNKSVEALEVIAGEDKLHGTKVTIQIELASETDQQPLHQQIHDCLAPYTLHYEVVYTKV